MNTFVLEMISGLIVVMLITPFHEFAHAFAANKLGDRTAEEEGRLTINPLAHIDPIGALCIILCGFGWAKPVPVNPFRFNPMRTQTITTKSGKQKVKKTGISMRAGMAVTAAAGPIANLLAALIVTVILRIASTILFKNYPYAVEYLFQNGLMPSDSQYAKYFILLYVLYFIVIINVNLAVFNLIPIPPLDGSKILGFFLGRKFEGWLYKYQQQLSFGFMIVIIATNFIPQIGDVIFAPLSWISWNMFNLLWTLTNWIPSLIL